MRPPRCCAPPLQGRGILKEKGIIEGEGICSFCPRPPWGERVRVRGEEYLSGERVASKRGFACHARGNLHVRGDLHARWDLQARGI